VQRKTNTLVSTQDSGQDTGIFGALIGGVTLYNDSAKIDVRRAQFTDYIWKKMRDERNYPSGLMVRLIIIAGNSLFLGGNILYRFSAR
jgi:hypothetical protein